MFEVKLLARYVLILLVNDLCKLLKNEGKLVEYLPVSKITGRTDVRDLGKISRLFFVSQDM